MYYARPSMNRRTLLWLSTALVLGVAIWAAFWWKGRESDLARRDEEAQAQERDARREARRTRLREESGQLMPELLEGTYLGMSLDDARAARPGMAPAVGADNPEERDKVVFEERFPNGARAMYVFDWDSDRLQRVQVLSLLPSVDALPAHLSAMNTQYGSPTGVWDCPDTGGVPTRRFTWRHGATTVSDVMLVYGGRVSVTLYVAPSAVIGRSLRMGHCHPIREPRAARRVPRGHARADAGSRRGALKGRRGSSRRFAPKPARRSECGSNMAARVLRSRGRSGRALRPSGGAPMSEPSPDAAAVHHATLPPDAKRRRRSRLKALGRIVLLALGVIAIVGLVTDAGPAAVGAVLKRAAIYLPLVVVCELGFVGVDIFSLRYLYGERARGVPIRVWLRSAIVAYGVMIFLPAGRTGAEVVRAANLAPHVGVPRAAAAATALQGSVLLGNTLVSLVCYVAVLAAAPSSMLGWLVVGNAVVTFVIGGAILFGARHSRVGGWLGRRIAALAAHGTRFDESLRELPAPHVPVALSFLGRLFQTVEYGVILVAVGATLTGLGPFVAQAISLVAAGVGDMVPNQLGVSEGAYRLFATTLGLADAVAAAISIALVQRICQFSLAGASVLIGALWKPATAPRPSSSPHP